MKIDYQQWLSIVLVFSLGFAPLQAASTYDVFSPHHNKEKIPTAAELFGDDHHSDCGDEDMSDIDLSFKVNNDNHSNEQNHHCKNGACECDSCGYCSTVHINMALTTFLVKHYRSQRASSQSAVQQLSQDIRLPIETRPPITR